MNISPNADSASAVHSVPAQDNTDEPLFKLSGKKRKAVWPFVAIPVIAVLLLGILFAVWYTHPKTVLAQTLGGYLREWTEGNALVTALADAVDGGVIHMEYRDEEGADHLCLDLYRDHANQVYAQLTDGSVTLYHTENAFMAEGKPFGDTVYGISSQGIYEQFKSSIFHPDAGGRYALPLSEEELDDLQDGLARLESAYPKDAPETRLAEKYYKLFVNTLLENAEVKFTEVSAGKTMEIALSPEALGNAITSFAAVMTTDSELAAYLNAYLPMDPETDDFDTWEGEFEWMMMKANQLAENYLTRELSLVLRLTYTPFTRELQSMSVIMDYPDRPHHRVELDATQEGRATMSVQMKGVKFMEFQLTQTDTRFGFEMSSLNLKGGLDSLLELAYEEQADGSYQISLRSGNGTQVSEWLMDGRVSREEGCLRFTADKVWLVTAGQGATEPQAIGLTVELRDKAKMPAFPTEYSDIFAITEGEMDTLAKGLDLAPEDVVSKLMEIYTKLTENQE